MLRGSDENADIAAITEGRDTGVLHDEELTAFVEAVLSRAHDLERKREALRRAVGDEGLVDACGVIATFTMMVRIADATGIPLDDDLALGSVAIREEMGVSRFGGARPNAWLVERVGRVVGPLVPLVMRLQSAVMGLRKR